MSSLKAILAMAALFIGSASAQIPRRPGAPGRPVPHKNDGAVYYGAIDLGSSGSKAALYSFVTDEDGPSPDLLFSQTINTTLVSSMADGRFTSAGIADATQAVTRLVDTMKSEATTRGISIDHLYIVGSSAVAKALNKGDLVSSVKKATNIDMDFIDAAHEGYYGTRSAIPTSRLMNSMYIDIGSGNAKLGCLVGGTTFQDYKSAEIPYGSKSGRNEALKRKPKDIVAGVDSVMTDVGASYNEKSMNVPCLRNRRFIYWSGGASWATATYTHPERSLSGYVTISHRDLETFLASLKDDTWLKQEPLFTFPPNVSAPRKAAIRTKALSDRADVQNVFVREDLLSGVSIMKTVVDLSNPASFIQFVRNGNYIYGYALDKYTGASDKADVQLLSSAPAVQDGVSVKGLGVAQDTPPLAPVIRSLVVPAGTTLLVRLIETLNSGITTEGTTFTGMITSTIGIDGESAIPAGCNVLGRVISVHDAARFSGSSLLTVELTTLNRRNETFALYTSPVTFEGKGRGKNIAKDNGSGAAVGTVPGDGKGAVIAAASTGAVGAGSNAVTKREQVLISSEQIVAFHLSNAITVSSLGRMGQEVGLNSGLQTRMQ